ncbi:hypothetical protein L7F22_032663 [Adiantum nelumboides]|nr:hypothetical protein [Adiantum nelumboides]
MQQKNDQLQHQQRHQQQQALLKVYNAVPPPLSLYSGSRRNPSPNSVSRSRPNPNLSPYCNQDANHNFNANNGDLERRSRRRSRVRRPQDAALEAMDALSSSGSNGAREGSVIRRNESASSSDIQGCTSSIQSPSPNCMPSPSFNGEGCCSANLSQADASFKSLSDGVQGHPAGIYTPNRASTCTHNISKCKDNSTAKPKWKDTCKHSHLANGDLNKLERMKYSSKVRSDMASSSNYSQDDSCTGIFGSRLLLDEGSTSSSCKDEPAFLNSRQGLQLSHCPTIKGRYIQKAKFEKATSQRICFEPHWPSPQVEKALEGGEAFRCKIRVNAHMRTEGAVGGFRGEDAWVGFQGFDSICEGLGYLLTGGKIP